MTTRALIQDEAVQAARARVARIGRLLFERQLTDAAGGNISERVGEVICMSPRYSGTTRQWQLQPDDVLVCDLERNILAGSGQISRESNVHFRLHRDFGQYGTAVIHAHARNILVLSVLERPLPPLLEATRKFGVTPVIPYAPAHSPKLAELVAGTMQGREDRIKKHAAATIAPWHGLFLMAKDLNAGFDAVERMDTSAYIMLMGQMVPGASPLLEREAARMEAIIGGYQED
ncbi:MAG: class II aldolase/adducin family protein [Anaerolineae bacterium]|jgi:L-fuculose-phosphate aldolase|nr:class II aldolase/adducin family protein [Anaerolineae bacterium]